MASLAPSKSLVVDDFDQALPLEQVRRFLSSPVPTKYERLRDGRLDALFFSGSTLDLLPKREARAFLNAYHVERLEFRGDRLWSLIVTDVLFLLQPSNGENVRPLHDERNRLCTNEMGTRLARELGLDQYRGVTLEDSLAADHFEAYIAALEFANGRKALLSFLVPLIRREFFARFDSVPALLANPKEAVGVGQTDGLEASETLTNGPVLGTTENLVSAIEEFHTRVYTHNLPESFSVTSMIMFQDFVFATGQGRTAGLANSALVDEALEKGLLSIDPVLKTRSDSLPLRYRSPQQLETNAFSDLLSLDKKNTLRVTHTWKFAVPGRESIEWTGSARYSGSIFKEMVRRCCLAGLLQVNQQGSLKEGPISQAPDESALLKQGTKVARETASCMKQWEIAKAESGGWVFASKSDALRCFTPRNLQAALSLPARLEFSTSYQFGKKNYVATAESPSRAWAELLERKGLRILRKSNKPVDVAEIRLSVFLYLDSETVVKAKGEGLRTTRQLWKRLFEQCSSRGIVRFPRSDVAQRQPSSTDLTSETISTNTEPGKPKGSSSSDSTQGLETTATAEPSQDPPTSLLSSTTTAIEANTPSTDSKAEATTTLESDSAVRATKAPDASISFRRSDERPVYFVPADLRSPHGRRRLRKRLLEFCPTSLRLEASLTIPGYGVFSASGATIRNLNQALSEDLSGRGLLTRDFNLPQERKKLPFNRHVEAAPARITYDLMSFAQRAKGTVQWTSSLELPGWSPSIRTGTLLGDRTLANIAPLYMDYVERGAIVVVDPAASILSQSGCADPSTSVYLETSGRHSATNERKEPETLPFIPQSSIPEPPDLTVEGLHATNETYTDVSPSSSPRPHKLSRLGKAGSETKAISGSTVEINVRVVLPGYGTIKATGSTTKTAIRETCSKMEKLGAITINPDSPTRIMTLPFNYRFTPNYLFHDLQRLSRNLPGAEFTRERSLCFPDSTKVSTELKEPSEISRPLRNLAKAAIEAGYLELEPPSQISSQTSSSTTRSDDEGLRNSPARSTESPSFLDSLFDDDATSSFELEEDPLILPASSGATSVVSGSSDETAPFSHPSSDSSPFPSLDQKTSSDLSSSAPRL